MRQYRSLAAFISNLIGFVRQYRGFVTFHIKLSRFSETVSQFVNFFIRFSRFSETVPRFGHFRIERKARQSTSINYKSQVFLKLESTQLGMATLEELICLSGGEVREAF